MRCATTPDDATGDLAARRDPIARLIVDTRTAAADVQALRERIPSVDELARMVPPGTLDDEHAGPDDPTWLAERAASAERMVLGRLGAATEAS